MSAFDHLLGRGVGLLFDTIDSPTISKGAGTARCLSTPIAHGREMRDAGYWPETSGVVEVLRSEAEAMRLEVKDLVEYRHTGRGLALKLKIVGIEDDPSDPCLKLTLKQEPAAPGARAV